jgi:hypothetical protein
MGQQQKSAQDIVTWRERNVLKRGRSLATGANGDAAVSLRLIQAFRDIATQQAAKARPAALLLL